MSTTPGMSWSGDPSASSATHPVDRNSLPLVSVYSPNAVFWVSFLISLLGGFIVSAINWSRLESPAKARMHIIIGVIVFIGLIVLFAALPNLGIVVWVINLGAAFYLRSATQKDIDADAGIKRVDIANAWGAVGIGVVCLVVAGILALLLRPVMSS